MFAAWFASFRSSAKCRVEGVPAEGGGLSVKAARRVSRCQGSMFIGFGRDQKTSTGTPLQPFYFSSLPFSLSLSLSLSTTFSTTPHAILSPASPVASVVASGAAT
jgi:hypothetical protein